MIRAVRPILSWLALAGAAALPFLLAAIFVAPALPVAREAMRDGFVGSATCAGCHQSQAEAWRSSDHARAMAPAADGTVLGDFSGVTVADRDRSATFFRDGDRFMVRTDGPGGATADFQVTETFGHDPLQQYLVLFPDGRRQPLPWAWDSRPRQEGGQRWYHLMPDEALRAGDPLHWTGRDQNWNFMCAACHSTGLQRGYQQASNRYDTRWSEISVGCESCHGRGAAHVAWARDGARADVGNRGLEILLRDPPHSGWRFADGDPRGIARWEGPPRSRAVTEVESCAPCHARARPIVEDPLPGARFLDTHAPALLEAGLYRADGQILGEVFEYGSFLQSRMHRAGVVCSDCHDPHTTRRRAEGNAVCAQCHLPARFDTAEHHYHPPGTPGAQCVSCHMPAVTYMGVDRRRDHAFRVPRPDIAAQAGVPDACTSCHTNQSQAWAAERIVAWFGPQRRDTPHPALAIAAARRGERGADAGLSEIARDRAQSAILRATAVSLLPMPPSQVTAATIGAALLDPEPLVRVAALRTLDALHPRNRIHAARFLDDPIRLVRIEAARALAPVPMQAVPEPQRPAFERAWAELLASERVAAERPESHVNIAALLAARGDAAGAEAAYRQALRLDPAYLPAMVNFANLETARGRHDAAEAQLRRAVEAHPGSAEAHYALALARVRQGRRQEAMEPLRRASELQPDDVRFPYAYAIGLNDLRRSDEAVVVLRETLARHPANVMLLMALAAIERDRSNLGEAERLAALAVAAEPQNRDAQQMLAQLRAARQRLPGAR